MMASMRPKPIRVAAGVIRKKGLYLAALRPEGDSLGGMWEFPGGKIEDGESPEACLAREIREELGLAIEVNEPLCTITHAYPKKTIELWVFLCTTDGEPSRLEAHDEFRWLKLEQLDSLDWAPADVPAVAELKRRLGLS
jgi:8-oxo-dGTP diphosphatase